MSPIDYIILVASLLGITAFGTLFTRRSSKSTADFMLGGRTMPFWLAGASNVATDLNANSPLTDSRKARDDGIAGYWFNLQGILTGAWASVFFNRLWRRAGIMTPLEIYDLRYSGWTAKGARIFDTVVLAGINGTIWSAIGLVGLKKVATGLFDMPETVSLLGMNVPSDWLVVLLVTALALTYSVSAGVNGVVWTDLIELIIALGCTYILVWNVYAEIGGPVGLREAISGLGDGEGRRLLSLLPELGPAFVVLLLVQPILSLGHYNSGVQRSLCVKDERETLYMHYFGTVVSNTLKMWPFLMIGLAGIFIISDADLLSAFPAIQSPSGRAIPDYEMVYPLLIERFMPPGLTGLMLAGFLFAFMSSIDTNIHNNGSMFVNDLYRPFLRKGASEHHYINVQRGFMVLQTLCAVVIGILVDNILWLIIFALNTHNSVGISRVARFLWWRVNSQMEFTSQFVGLAMVCFVFFTTGGQAIVSDITLLFGNTSNDAHYAVQFLLITMTASAAGLLVLLVTPPEDEATLLRFFSRFRPYGCWGKLRTRYPQFNHTDSVPLLWMMFAATLAWSIGGIFVAIASMVAMWGLALFAAVLFVLGSWGFFHAVRQLYPSAQDS